MHTSNAARPETRKIGLPVTGERVLSPRGLPSAAARTEEKKGTKTEDAEQSGANQTLGRGKFEDGICRAAFWLEDLKTLGNH